MTVYNTFSFEVMVVNSLAFLKGRGKKGNKKKRREEVRSSEKREEV